MKKSEGAARATHQVECQITCRQDAFGVATVHIRGTGKRSLNSWSPSETMQIERTVSFYGFASEDFDLRDWFRGP
jgi:hypothetical protein